MFGLLFAFGAKDSVFIYQVEREGVDACAVRKWEESLCEDILFMLAGARKSSGS